GGLSAAAVLLELGHKFKIFDKAQSLGGMVQSVIPAERQGRALNREIEAIFKDLPQSRMELRLNTVLDENFNLNNILQDGFDAVFIGIGLPKGINSFDKKINGLYDALEFLAMAKQSDKSDLSGKKVAVIGGGNTAMDAATTAKQLGSADVYLIYRRSFEQMPAWEAERQRAMEQGIHFIILTGQLGYETENGKLTAIKVCPTKLSEPDNSGRRKPIADKKNEYKLEMDIIIEAIGQSSDDNLEKILPGVKIEQGLIKTLPDSFATSRNAVYAGGDIAGGASTVVAAVADGMKAAREIDKYLKGEK
ncbi:MAG: FAD-dependent oxidoreductase, partial [Phycisphaerales bacterium]